MFYPDAQARLQYALGAKMQAFARLLVIEAATECTAAFVPSALAGFGSLKGPPEPGLMIPARVHGVSSPGFEPYFLNVAGALRGRVVSTCED